MQTDAYRIDFDEIKRSVPMDQVVAYLGISGLRARSARQWKGPCPFCKGVDCFVVSNDGGREKTGAFNCFKCPAGGDQIELVSLSRGHTRKDRQGAFDAAKELHEKFFGSKEGGGNPFFEQYPPAHQGEKDRVRSGSLRQGPRSHP